MTQTTQPRSLAYLSEPEKTTNRSIPEAEDNITLLLSVYDSLNKLCERLSRLEYALKRKRIESIFDKEGEKK